MKVIVTGASRGIGKGIASFLALEEFEVGLLARSKDELEDLQRSLSDQGAHCYIAACDLRDARETQRSIDALAEGLGGVDALINNAGIVLRKSAFDISIDEWHDMVDTNINGLFHATKALLPMFRERQSGHFINLSSISGKVPLPGGSAYAATKYAVTGFSQSLFQEVRDDGIRVTVVFPGSVDTLSHRTAADASWKVTPEEVGRVCRDVLRAAPGTCISEVEVRPLARPPKL